MRSKDYRFFYLLAGLLFALLVTPVASERSPEIHGLTSSISLLICVFSMSSSRRVYVAGWVLVAAKILLDIAGHIHPSSAAYVAETFVLFAFLDRKSVV